MAACCLCPWGGGSEAEGQVGTATAVLNPVVQPHCIPTGDPEHPMLSPTASHANPTASHVKPCCTPRGDPEHPVLSPTASHMQPQCMPYSTPLQSISIRTASHAQPHCIPYGFLLHPTLSPTASPKHPPCISCSALLHPTCSPTAFHAQPRSVPCSALLHPTWRCTAAHMQPPLYLICSPTASHAQPHCIPHAEDIGQRLWGRSDDTLGMESAASSPAGAKCSSGIFSFLFILFFFLTCLAKALSFASPAASFLLPQYGGFTAPNPGGAQGHPIPTPLLGLSPQCRSGHSAVGRSPPTPPTSPPSLPITAALQIFALNPSCGKEPNLSKEKPTKNHRNSTQSGEIGEVNRGQHPLSAREWGGRLKGPIEERGVIAAGGARGSRSSVQLIRAFEDIQRSGAMER